MSPEQQLFKEQAENTRKFVAVEANKNKAVALKNPSGHQCTLSHVLAAKSAYDEAVKADESALLGDGPAIDSDNQANMGSAVGGGLQLPAAAMADESF